MSSEFKNVVVFHFISKRSQYESLLNNLTQDDIHRLDKKFDIIKKEWVDRNGKKYKIKHFKNFEFIELNKYITVFCDKKKRTYGIIPVLYDESPFIANVKVNSQKFATYRYENKFFHKPTQKRVILEMCARLYGI